MPSAQPWYHSQILDIRTDSPDLITSLSTLSSFYGENTPAARKALRSTIEKRGLAINERFLGAAEGVIQVCDWEVSEVSEVRVCGHTQL